MLIICIYSIKSIIFIVIDGYLPTLAKSLSNANHTNHTKEKTITKMLFTIKKNTMKLQTAFLTNQNTNKYPNLI